VKTIEMPTDHDVEVVEMLRAIANPARYRILLLLKERGACQCGPLGDALPIAPSTLSEHLKVLREAGLIKGAVDGPALCYCRDEERLAWFKERLAEL
jgi:ArsR family transcriptional regulator